MIKLHRTLLLTLLSLCCFAAAQAQEVSWKSTVKHLEANSYQILFEAAIPAGYHMYDMGPYELGGPNATEITLTPGEGVTLDGGVKQLSKPERHYDELFGMEIGTFAGKALFAQRVTLTAPQAEVKAQLDWMICNDTSCMPPSDTELTVELTATGTGAASQPAAGAEVSAAQTSEGNTPAAEISQSAQTSGSGDSIWSYLLAAIGWGFLAILTPCIFPMVPMTVSFFMKGEGGVSRGVLRAVLYGVMIVALYTLPIAAIILITLFIGGDAVMADIFNWLATHWLPNIIFFAVFMLFAASFFGAFEITLPSWMVNKSDSKADSKGLAGIFFLALTLVLVSFSCTGPIVSTVVIGALSGKFWTPILSILVFSTVFALPFVLFAIFPSLLKKLPKSGGWLNSVKVVLGFIEVALGMKFLSVADQTYHWGLLDREVYLAIWIVVFTLLGLYLLGKLKFSHDSDVPYLSVGRLGLSIVTFSFVVYLIPGMWGAPLKALSGYLPPLHTQDFVLGANTGTANSPSGAAMLQTADGQKPKYSDFLHLPHGLEGFFDLQEAEAYAAKVNKPLFIDFTGHGCVNCREMEARVWSAPEVLQILRNDYVIVALYGDDKKTLPESDWVTTETGKVLKNLGKINSYYMFKTYGANAQPYYVLQGRNGKVLVPPRGYDLSVEGFVKFLQSGVEAYRRQQ